MQSTSKFLKIFPAILICLAASSFTNAPTCDPEELLKKCASSLDNYVFIKSFNIESARGGDKAEYSYVLSRGIQYRIVIYDENEEGKKMIINLLDRNKKLIASNYVRVGKKIYPTLNYECAATGVYYVEAFFEGEKKGCGINVLGFKK
ncbi:MAG: hypothetical protein V4635_02180 [Bacteroidota bacterium]